MGGVNCHSIIYSGKVMWLILMMASCLKSAYEHANSTATPFSFSIASESFQRTQGQKAEPLET